MNKAWDELVDDYMAYRADCALYLSIGAGLTFTEWCNSPLFCDQELLAQALFSRPTRGRLVPAGEPISPVGTES